MTTTPRHDLPRSDDPLAAVRDLAPLVRARAEQSEIDARLDDEVVNALVAAGTMTLMVPACLGGAEAHPSLQLDVVDELSYADGSTGWAVMASMTAMGTLLSLLPDEGVDRVLTSTNYVCAGAVAPPGRAVATDAGYLVAGRIHLGTPGLTPRHLDVTGERAEPGTGANRLG